MRSGRILPDPGLHGVLSMSINTWGEGVKQREPGSFEG